jgi:ribosomal subunit interface protein
VVLKHEKNGHQKGFTVEVRLAVPKEDLFAEEAAESFSLALERVTDDLKKQITKRKDKFKRPDGFRQKLSVEELPSE